MGQSRTFEWKSIDCHWYQVKLTILRNLYGTGALDRCDLQCDNHLENIHYVLKIVNYIFTAQRLICMNGFT